MKVLDKLYEGKAKMVFATDDPGVVVIRYKDDATAFDGKKKGTIRGKGEVNARMSAELFRMLEAAGIPTHFKELLSPTEMACRRLEIIPIEVVVRNIAAGSLSKRLGLAEGTVLSGPVVEFYYKSDELGDPMINTYHIAALGLATKEDVAEIERLALAVNTELSSFFAKIGIDLVDFKLEFGRGADGRIYLGDEISPDTCRFWDSRTKEKLDKDRFRRDLGRVEEAYQEVLARVLGGKEQEA